MEGVVTQLEVRIHFGDRCTITTRYKSVVISFVGISYFFRSKLLIILSFFVKRNYLHTTTFKLLIIPCER